MKNVDWIWVVFALSFCFFVIEIAHVLHDVVSDCVVYKAGMVKGCK